MDKELLYTKLSEVLELLETRRVYDAQVQLEGFINEIKYGVYDK
jgi:hypothetical protein